MSTATVSRMKAEFSSYLDRLQDGPVIITKHGRPVALLVAAPEDDDELERLVLAHSPRFQRLLADAERRIREGGGIEHDEFWRQVDAEYGDAPVEQE